MGWIELAWASLDLIGRVALVEFAWISKEYGWLNFDEFGCPWNA